MKKLWRKFKHWLIRKLGGYVQGPVASVKVQHVRPVRLYSSMQQISKDRYHNDAEYRFLCQRGLLMGFVEEILKNHRDVVLIRETTDSSPNDAFVTATLRASIDIIPNPEVKCYENS